MKRCAVVTLFVAAVALSGCVQPPPATPPSGPSAPAGVESMSVSPTPVVAGETFTVTISASDDIAVTDIEWRLLPPTGTETVECDGGFTPQPTVTAVYTCTMPSTALNGNWSLGARAFDGEVRGGMTPFRGQLFEVVGGSDDI